MNSYEMLAREKKATALALALAIRKLGGDADSAAKLSDAGWEYLARVAGVKPPSQLTRDAVVEMLRKERG
jgi:hypothetical protein